MPKLVLALGAEAAKVEAVEGFANYNGPTPPPGVYPAVIKQIAVTESKSKKPMFRTVVEFKAPNDDPRKKYNGYAIFHHLVVPESKDDEYFDLQVGQINRMLDAMSGNDMTVRNVLWMNKADTDAAGKKLTKIGKVSLETKSGVPVLVSAKAESFKRKVLKNGKPVKDPRTGKELFEEASNLRVNDFFPIDDERGAIVAEEPETDTGENYFVDEDGDALDEQPVLDTDADGGLDDSDDEAVADDEGLFEESAVDVESSDDDLAAFEEAPAEAEPEFDESALIAAEVPEEESAIAADAEVVETPAPAAPARRRRSAF